ncbi:MAG: EAL domain-containing protein [Candidatus Izemoplasmatales bacterium]
MIFGAYMITSNKKSRINRLFLLVTSSMAIWSFSYAISNSAPTAESSAFWRCMSVFGWGFFHSLLLHFVLILTNTEKRLNKRIKLIILYLPVFINVILFAPLGILAEKQYEMVQSEFGWINVLPINIGQIWLNIYDIIYSVITIILLFRWWKKIEPHTPLKLLGTYFLLSVLLPFIAGSITDILPGVLPGVFGLTPIPQLAILFLILPTVLLFIILKKFGFLIEREKIEFLSPDSDIIPEESRLRLFETAAAIFIIGSAGSFYSGFFLARGKLAYELLLAFAILICGIFLRFIPHISKNHTIQNAIFLVTSVVGMTFFIIKDANTAATTVWAVYIIFLLHSIVLDNKNHTLIFLAVTLITQVVLSIIYPEVSATINAAQYLKRIFIIVLSYFAVIYLKNEYSSKFRGYQRFSKEQQTLEKISTNFISVSSENTKEKIDEMFKMSAEILNFDSAYLFEFSADYENAIILNTYVKDLDNQSFPFYPETTFKTADFPEVKSLITQNSPILCEDVTSLPLDEAGYQRNFFLSRGINSFFALPIIVDERTDGFFVIEYLDRSDKKFTENRLHFLKIITNILGDTKKKSLYEEKLYQFAYFDESTKLANRNMLKKILEENIYNRKESDKLVVFDIELDNLRMINDTFGHSIGEHIAIKSATILENLMKEECHLSRIGEGKFIVVMPFAETTEQIEECANKIVDAFSNPILPKEGIESLFVTVNVGISIYPDDGKDVDTLLKNADLASYEAKLSENRIVFCSEQLKKRIAENTLLTNKLFHSLQNEEFSLEYQPQVSCSTGKVVGVEALLRWTTADNVKVSPNIFIPILEQTGLIHDVGLWVLEQAIQEHNKLVSKGFFPLRFSVNLSVVQFQSEDFISKVLQLIKKSQVDPKYIELEITESMLSNNFSDTIEKLSKLKEAGINIAIDDFGKGYSSLHRLELVPFNRIKIDKSIIDDIILKEKKSSYSKNDCFIG